jgi:hypothetical protein
MSAGKGVKRRICVFVSWLNAVYGVSNRLGYVV